MSESKKIQRVKSLVIDRSQWRTGATDAGEADGESGYYHGEETTALLSPVGFKCCLGFLALAEGFAENDVRHVGEPSDIIIDDYEETIGQSALLVLEDTDEPDEDGDIVFISHTAHCSDLSSAAMSINDNNNLPHEVREQRLTELFAKYGIELTFQGEYQKSLLGNSPVVEDSKD